MQLFGSNTPAIVQYLLAFVIVLGVLAVFAAVLRRITGSRPRLGYPNSSARHRQQRLGVIDAVDIDAHRQLLLLRRDNVEHLVLIGGPNDVLVESGIGRLPYRAPLQAQHAAPADGHGEPVRLDPSLAPGADTEPGAGIAAAAKAAGIAGAAGIARAGLDPLPPPVAATKSILPDAAPARAPVTPPSVPVPPRSLATPVAPNPASPNPTLPNPTLPKPAAEDAVPEFITAPPAVPAREPPKGPFSAVARQLEEALKRPFAAVRPSPVTGIDLDDAAPAQARAGEPTAGDKPADKGVDKGTHADRGTHADKGAHADKGTDAAGGPLPPPPVQATLPLPPVFPARDEGRHADGSSDSLPLPRRGLDAGPAFERSAPAVTPVPPSQPVPPQPVSPLSPLSPLSGLSSLLPPAADTPAAAGRPASPSADADVLSANSLAARPSAPAPAPAPAQTTPVQPAPVQSGPSVQVSARVSPVENAAGRPTSGPAASVTPPSVTEPSQPEREAASTTPATSEKPASSDQAPSEPLILGPDDPADTLEVPAALKTTPESASGQPARKDPFDLSSLENIEAEFARLLGRTSPPKDK